MKKSLLIFTILFLAGCQTNMDNNTYDLLNTYKNTKLDFEIMYPKDWVVTDYVDFNKNDGVALYLDERSISEIYGIGYYERFGSGVNLKFSNYPAPYGGYNLNGNPFPEDYLSIGLSINSQPTYEDYSILYEDDFGIELLRNESIKTKSGKVANLYVFGYPDNYDGFKELTMPQAIAEYEGTDFNYVFDVGPFVANEKEIELLSKMLETFIELN